jgi:hypothetical protein
MPRSSLYAATTMVTGNTVATLATGRPADRQFRNGHPRPMYRLFGLGGVWRYHIGAADGPHVAVSHRIICSIEAD